MPLLIQENLTEHASWALWKINEDIETLHKQLFLSRQEQDELNNIKVDSRKLEWLASRILLKSLAKSHQDRGREPEIVKDVYGKPHLAGSAVSISLSHSFPFAAAIIHTQQEVGIDIEKPREQLLRIQHKFLSPEERSDAKNDLQKLCVYWTAKEALYKLYGRRQLILQEQILISPFQMAESGQLEGFLIANQVKQPYTLHYRCFKGIHICFNL